MRTGVPCNENRGFPVGIGSQGVPYELYRVWVCSVRLKADFVFGFKTLKCHQTFVKVGFHDKVPGF